MQPGFVDKKLLHDTASAILRRARADTYNDPDPGLPLQSICVCRWLRTALR